MFQLMKSDILQRSVISPMVPEALVFYLNNYGPERYAQVFLGEFDDPEVIWNAEMRLVWRLFRLNVGPRSLRPVLGSLQHFSSKDHHAPSIPQDKGLPFFLPNDGRLNRGRRPRIRCQTGLSELLSSDSERDSRSRSS